MVSKLGQRTRRQIDDDLFQLAQRWETKGMPMLGSMLRIVGFAYRRQLEGDLETLMETWLWCKEKMEARVALVNGRPIPPTDGRARTEETASRHQRKYELLAGAAARERRVKTKPPQTRRR